MMVSGMVMYCRKRARGPGSVPGCQWDRRRVGAGFGWEMMVSGMVMYCLSRAREPGSGRVASRSMCSGWEDCRREELGRTGADDGIEEGSASIWLSFDERGRGFKAGNGGTLFACSAESENNELSLLPHGEQ
jgi:hypothetical protein